jgi:hypothetical protein
MNLNLCSAVQGHFIEEGTMIFKFPDTSIHHILFQCVDEDKLIGMHGNPYAMLSYELADLSKLSAKMAGPVEGTHGVGGKRDQVRAYSKKVKAFLNVVLQNLKKAVQIVFNFLNEPLLRVVGQSESRIGGATDSTVYTRVSDFQDNPPHQLRYC